MAKYTWLIFRGHPSYTSHRPFPPLLIRGQQMVWWWTVFSFFLGGGVNIRIDLLTKLTHRKEIPSFASLCHLENYLTSLEK
jgi:hypothetical protein